MFCSKKRKEKSKSNGCACKPICKGQKSIRGQPRNKSLRRKLQYIFQPELCCPKACAIFGAMDRPYHKKILSKCSVIPSRSKVKAYSLGTPVGLVCSSVSIQPSNDNEVHSMRYATYLKAFALIYLLPENEWTESNIDRLLHEGELLYKYSKEQASVQEQSLVSFQSNVVVNASAQSIMTERKSGRNENDVPLQYSQEEEEEEIEVNSSLKFPTGASSSTTVPTTAESEVYYRTQSFLRADRERNIIQNFSIENHIFTVELQPIFSGSKRSAKTSQQILINLKKFMREFFHKYRYCLFWTEEFGYLLIWRRRGAYFVLDINGREKSNFTYVNREGEGVAMLMCLKTLDNVFYLISQLSGVSMTDMFQLRQLIVTRLETPDGRVFTRDTNLRKMEYTVISNDYAYLKSQLHLSFNPHEHSRNRASVMVGVAAIIASKIDHPAAWNTYVFDRIICHGLKMCRNCWESCKKHTINLDKFPTQLRLGQYVAELKLLPSVSFGNWRCSKPFRGNDFERLLIGALDEHNSVLFQINNQMYAIWLSHGFYYLLDSYRHTVESQSTETRQEKSASLRMFRTKLTLLRVFHGILSESNRSSSFYIHALKIKNLQSVPDGFALVPLPEELNIDAQSLNETICFAGDYKDCVDELSQISGYELDIISYTEKPLDYDAMIDIGKDEDLAEEMGEEESDLEGIEMSDDIDRSTQKKEKPKRDGSKSKLKSKLKPKKSKSQLRPKKVSISNIKEIIESNKDQERDRGIDDKSARNSKSKSRSNSKKVSISNVKEIITKMQEPQDFGPTESQAAPRSEKKKRKKVKNGSLSSDHQEQEDFGPTESQAAPRSEKKKRKKVKNGSLSSDHQEQERDSGLTEKSARYPGYSKDPQNMAVCGSESGTIESLERLIRSAFKCADRVLMLTPWGNYVVFRESNYDSRSYYVFEGCMCNIDRFRHLDLRFGTAGLKPFQHQCQVVRYIIDSREGNALKVLRTRLNKSCQHLETLKARGP